MFTCDTGSNLNRVTHFYYYKVGSGSTAAAAAVCMASEAPGPILLSAKSNPNRRSAAKCVPDRWTSKADRMVWSNAADLVLKQLQGSGAA
jgi:hypothetical protein